MYKKTFEIEYNPYSVQTVFKADGKVIEDSNSVFGKGYAWTNEPLETWVDELIDEIDDYLAAFDIELIFRGLDEHYQLIKSVVDNQDDLNVLLTNESSLETLERKHKRFNGIMKNHSMEINNTSIENIKESSPWTYNCVNEIHANLIEQFKSKQLVQPEPEVVTETVVIDKHAATRKELSILIKNQEHMSGWEKKYRHFLSTFGQMTTIKSNEFYDARRVILQSYIDLVIDPLMKRECPDANYKANLMKSRSMPIKNLGWRLITSLDRNTHYEEPNSNRINSRDEAKNLAIINREKQVKDDTPRPLGGYVKPWIFIYEENRTDLMMKEQLNTIRKAFINRLCDEGAQTIVEKEVKKEVEKVFEAEQEQVPDDIIAEIDTLVSI